MSQSFLAQSIASFDWHYGERAEMWSVQRSQFSIQRIRAIPHEQGEAFLVWLAVEHLSGKEFRNPTQKAPCLRGFLLMLFEGANREPTLEKFVETYHVADFLFKQSDVATLKSIVAQLPQEQVQAEFQGRPKKGKPLIVEIQQFEKPTS